MTVEQVLAGVALRSAVPEGLRTAPVSALEYDSRRSVPGSLFFAFPGAKADGREFAQAALDKGAICILSELPAPAGFDGPWIHVHHGRQALAQASRNFYAAPDDRLGMTAVTGTNGKTTTVFLTDAILRHARRVTAVIGTIEYRLGPTVLPAVNTTPESLDLYRIFVDLLAMGGTHVTMEVSSHALALGRVYGVNFGTAVFTNLTRDHLDFHLTMEAYFAAKHLLFTPQASPPPRWAVINHDDAYGRRIQPAPETQVLRYGFEEGADLRAVDMRMGVAMRSWRINMRNPSPTLSRRSSRKKEHQIGIVHRHVAEHASGSRHLN